MVKVLSRDVYLFSKISGDKNKIHLSKKFSQKFFFKEPIIHGVLATLIGLTGFLKKHKKNVFFKKILINFHNYINVGEEFKIVYKNNSIILKNELNKKITISFEHEYKNSNLKKKNKYKSKFKLNKIFNLHLLNLLIKSSKLVGNNYPGNGGLIHQINYFTGENDFKNKVIVSKKRNFYKININEDKERVEIISSKTEPFKNTKKIINKRKNYKYNNLKIMIFGPGSILSNKVKEYFSLSNATFLDYSFRLNNRGLLTVKDKISIEKTIKKERPNLIFYFSSPKIVMTSKKNKFLNKIYNEVYFKVLIFLIKILKKNSIDSKIFYPSTIFLTNGNFSEKNSSYAYIKKKAEEKFKKKIYSNYIKCFRLPKYKSTSNYNLLGYYDGENINNFKYFLDKFTA